MQVNESQAQAAQQPGQPSAALSVATPSQAASQPSSPAQVGIYLQNCVWSQPAAVTKHCLSACVLQSPVSGEAPTPALAGTLAAALAEPTAHTEPPGPGAAVEATGATPGKQSAAQPAAASGPGQQGCAADQAAASAPTCPASEHQAAPSVAAQQASARPTGATATAKPPCQQATAETTSAAATAWPSGQQGEADPAHAPASQPGTGPSGPALVEPQAVVQAQHQAPPASGVSAGHQAASSSGPVQPVQGWAAAAGPAAAFAARPLPQMKPRQGGRCLAGLLGSARSSKPKPAMSHMQQAAVVDFSQQPVSGDAQQASAPQLPAATAAGEQPTAAAARAVQEPPTNSPAAAARVAVDHTAPATGQASVSPAQTSSLSRALLGRQQAPLAQQVRAVPA